MLKATDFWCIALSFESEYIYNSADFVFVRYSAWQNLSRNREDYNTFSVGWTPKCNDARETGNSVKYPEILLNNDLITRS